MSGINCMMHFSLVLQFLHNLCSCKTAFEKIRVAGTNGSPLSACGFFSIAVCCKSVCLSPNRRLAALFVENFDRLTEG